VLPVSQSQVVLLQASNNFVTNTHYFFMYKLRNSEGDSEASDTLEVSFAEYP